jgi:hypothetical protein
MTRKEFPKVAQQESALLRMHQLMEDHVDQLVASALADDGVIQGHEQAAIDRAKWMSQKMLVGHAAVTRGESMIETWDLDGSRRSERRTHELERDLGSNVVYLWPDDEHAA